MSNSASLLTDVPRWALLFERAKRRARVDFEYFRRFLSQDRLTKSRWQAHAARALQKFSDDLAAGYRPKLVIEAPPQHGKSSMVIDFIAWLCGRNPDLKVIYTSFSESLGERANLALQRIFTTPRFKAIFPNCQIAEVGVKNADGATRNKSLIEFKERGGYFRNTTVRGAITGETLDLGVIDDPIKGREEAGSAAVRQKTWEWFTDDFSTRFSKDAGMLAIMTRWHLDDPIGRLKDAAGADLQVLTYKAIAEVGDILERAEGEPLFPELKPLEFLQERKRLMANAHWQALYQQTPQAEGGEIIHSKDFKFYAVPPACKWYAIYGDTAQKTKEHNDYSVFECWGYTDDGGYVLLDLLRGKWEAPELERMALAFWQKWPKARFFAIEDKVSGTGLIQSIKRRGVPVKPLQRGADKYTRLLDVLGYIESGLVWIPAEAAWLADFISECESFTADGRHAHDDQVDPMIDAIAYGTAQRNVVAQWESFI